MAFKVDLDSVAPSQDTAKVDRFGSEYNPMRRKLAVVEK